jgi:hypothetical protein
MSFEINVGNQKKTVELVKKILNYNFSPDEDLVHWDFFIGGNPIVNLR